MAYDITFVSDYMRSMGVAKAYPKVMVDGQHRLLVLDYDIACLSLILQLRIEASKHMIHVSVNDHIPSYCWPSSYHPLLIYESLELRLHWIQVYLSDNMNFIYYAVYE